MVIPPTAETRRPSVSVTRLFLRAECPPGGRRNYKLAVKEPLLTSYEEDLDHRLGAWSSRQRYFPDRNSSRYGWYTAMLPVRIPVMIW